MLARAKAAGLVTKSGLIVGLGETVEEVHGALADLAAVGTDIVTIGQYLRPTAAHLPVARWWHPDEFEAVAEVARALGITHVEASPFTRSSHHAAAAYDAAVAAGDARAVVTSAAAERSAGWVRSASRGDDGCECDDHERAEHQEHRGQHDGESDTALPVGSSLPATQLGSFRDAPRSDCGVLVDLRPVSVAHGANLTKSSSGGR